MALTAHPTLAAWPERPITAIVPFAAGGGTDGVARILADHLGRNLGQAVVIENRGGANGNIGAVAAAPIHRLAAAAEDVPRAAGKG
jgi:tripartite-type tricarboxylate transporter receptor subunit TctC